MCPAEGRRRGCGWSSPIASGPSSGFATADTEAAASFQRRALHELANRPTPQAGDAELARPLSVHTFQGIRRYSHVA